MFVGECEEVGWLICGVVGVVVGGMFDVVVMVLPFLVVVDVVGVGIPLRRLVGSVIVVVWRCVDV